MRRIPSSVQGLLFAPVVICLFFILKAFCPESAGDSCFADQFAVPIFLPLVAVYKIFGDTSPILGQEFLFIIIYWAFLGFLIGLIFDLLEHKREVVEPIPEANIIAPPPITLPPQAPQVIKPVEVSLPATPLVPILKPKLPINILERKKEDWPTTPL